MTKKKQKPMIVSAAKAQTGHPLKNLLLIYLADYWSAEKGAYPSHTTLAKRCGGKTTRQHVQRLLDEMVADGWLTSTENWTEDGAQKSNTYHLNLVKIGATTDCRGATTDDRGCNDTLQGVQREIAGGATTDCTISLLKSPVKSLVTIPPIPPIAFDAFYDAYPKKTGRKEALKAWNKLDPQPALINRIMQDIHDRVEQGHWDTGKGKQYIPGPAPYINQEKWTDEIIPRPDYQPTEQQRAANVREMLDQLDEEDSWIK